VVDSARRGLIRKLWLSQLEERAEVAAFHFVGGVAARADRPLAFDAAGDDARHAVQERAEPLRLRRVRAARALRLV